MKDRSTRRHSVCSAQIVALLDAALEILEPLEHRDTTGEITEARFLLELLADMIDQKDEAPAYH